MKGFASLAESLNELIKNLEIEKPLKQGQALDLWYEVVGEKVAKKTKPIKIEHGKLFVRVTSPSWRNELQFYKHQIMHDLNERLGEQIVKEIVFM